MSKKLVLEELVDGWRILVKDVVVAKFGSANIQKNLAFKAFLNAKESMMLDHDEIEAIVYTDKAQSFIKGFNIPFIKSDPWKISKDFFDLNSSNFKNDLEKVLNTWNNSQEVLLRAGEMNPDELRTAMAVLGGLSRNINTVIHSSLDLNNSKSIQLEAPKPLHIEGFIPEHTGGGCMSLNYYPESISQGSLYIMVTEDTMQLPTTHSKEIEVGLYTPEGECLFFKEFKNDSESFVEVIEQLREISDNMYFEPSDDTMSYDDMLVSKEDDQYSIQISNSGKEYLFIASYLDSVGNGEMGYENPDIIESYKQILELKENNTPSGIINP